MRIGIGMSRIVPHRIAPVTDSYGADVPIVACQLDRARSRAWLVSSPPIRLVAPVSRVVSSTCVQSAPAHVALQIVPFASSLVPLSLALEKASPEGAKTLAPQYWDPLPFCRSSQPAVTAACMHAAVSSELTNRVNLR